MSNLEYKILSSEGNRALPELEVLVNHAISEGWNRKAE